MTILTIIIRLILLLFGLFIVPTAWACSCFIPKSNEFVSDIAVLFEGTAVKTEPRALANLSCLLGNRQVCETDFQSTFQVHKVYKGNLKDTVIIHYIRQDVSN